MTEISAESIGKKLKRKIKGNVLTDNISRYIYSTDSSMYKIKPLGIVQPKNAKDVQNVVKFCASRGITVHARGAASGLGGTALGEGIIIDFTRYMNKINEINPDEDYFVVETGLKGSYLQKELDKYNKYLPPDPSSFDYASIGGM
ncbi:MAG: FAD-binding oxidoreductase, partial [Candidatus Heimdallarchaeaceae archaeon]